MQALTGSADRGWRRSGTLAYQDSDFINPSQTRTYSDRIRRLQLTFFVEAHHRDAQQFCSLTFGDVLLGQGTIDQLIEKSWMLLWQRVSRLVLTPALGRKPFDHRQVARISDHATLLGPL